MDRVAMDAQAIVGGNSDITCASTAAGIFQRGGFSKNDSAAF